MFYDDNCMAVCEFLGIRDTKSAEFTFRSFMWLSQANRNDCIAGKLFLERLWKTLFLQKAIEGTFEWN